MGWPVLLLWGITAAFCGYLLGVQAPPCCPGEQRGCYADDVSGVQYCKRSGFGWERCQPFSGPNYPQALWRD